MGGGGGREVVNHHGYTHAFQFDRVNRVHVMHI